MTIAIVGAGSWGTTLAGIASQNEDVILYTRDSDRAKNIQLTRRNEKYLPEIELSNNVEVTSDVNRLRSANQVVFAIPSIGFREAIRIFSFLDPKIPYVSVTKGLEQKSNMRMSQVITDEDPRRSDEYTAVLGGPNLAHEIATNHPAATVIACANSKISESLQKIFMTSKFRVYTSLDVVGCEIGGVSKNVVAIAVGIGDGFGYGDNARAAVMTRALAEITRLGVAEGGNASTFSGLAGVGDLIATCTSPLSRNRSVGYALGQGKTLDEIRKGSDEIAEGIFSALALVQRAESLGVEMPIAKAVSKVIESGVVTSDAVEGLMSRPASKE